MSNLVTDASGKHSESGTLPFDEVVRQRRSIRGFLSTPVDETIICKVLDAAQAAPSNCNTQPWNTHIVSGDKLIELAGALQEAAGAERLSPDFSFDMNHFQGAYRGRKDAHINLRNDTLGLARDDKEGRRASSARNYSFYGAPHAALLFMPAIGDNVRVAADIGMYAQTFLLSLTAHGLGGIPQTSIGFFADTARKILGVSTDLKLLFGISFGHPDERVRDNQVRMGRAPISETVTFHH